MAIYCSKRMGHHPLYVDMRVLGCATAAWKLDRVWGTNPFATKIPRPITTGLLLLGFHQRFHLHIANASLWQSYEADRCNCPVNTAVLQHTQKEFQYCLDICHVTHGMHIKHLSISLHAQSYFIVVTGPVN